MENIPGPGNGEPHESDPILDAIGEIMRTMGVDDPRVGDIIERSLTALGQNTAADSPDLDEETLARNMEYVRQVPRHAVNFFSDDPIRQAESQRFMKQVMDFSEAIHLGTVHGFNADSHERFLDDPLAPEEAMGGLATILGTLRGETSDRTRQELGLPYIPRRQEEPPLFKEDEQDIAALLAAITTLFCRQAAKAGGKLITGGMLLGPPEVRMAVMEVAMTSDQYAKGDITERIALVDRVLEKFPMRLQTILTEQRKQRASLESDIENL